ncbi:MAG: hypothetical protein B7X93_03215 [Hydrogenophilales bacterium 17-61-9]|nr:MAG: hypothetical protein B7X93_03215 [Hydrogenophilales bacterium 17-61-9]
MLNLTARQQIAISLVLILLMLLTRSHHWASIHSLPDASWAIFFLLGVYVRALWVVPALIAASVAIDYVAITWGGVSDFCVSPAYWLLIPAYLALFAGGRFYARGHGLSLLGLFRLIGVALAVVVIAELLTSGGFYFFSGRFAEPTLAGFIPRFEQYFPRMLGTFALYLGVAAAVHVALAAAFRRDGDPRTLMGTHRER